MWTSLLQTTSAAATSGMVELAEIMVNKNIDLAMIKVMKICYQFTWQLS